MDKIIDMYLGKPISCWTLNSVELYWLLVHQRQGARATLSTMIFFTTIFCLPLLTFALTMSPPIQTVMVTGANGYLASHIVKKLLEKGYNVHACVRNASNEASVHHLRQLPSAAERLRLFSTGELGDPSLKGRYDEPLKGCDAIIHSATPLSPKLSGKEFDGERDMLRPGMIWKALVNCWIVYSNVTRCNPFNVWY